MIRLPPSKRVLCVFCGLFFKEEVGGEGSASLAAELNRLLLILVGTNLCRDAHGPARARIPPVAEAAVRGKQVALCSPS